MVLVDFRRSAAVFLAATLISIGALAATPDEASSNKSTRRAEAAMPPNFEALKNMSLIVVIEKTAIDYTYSCLLPGNWRRIRKTRGPAAPMQGSRISIPNCDG
jgi:hypothetical protein